jgi:hypothetical protein
VSLDLSFKASLRHLPNIFGVELATRLKGCSEYLSTGVFFTALGGIRNVASDARWGARKALLRCEVPGRIPAHHIRTADAADLIRAGHVLGLRGGQFLNLRSSINSIRPVLPDTPGDAIASVALAFAADDSWRVVMIVSYAARIVLGRDLAR